jgi:TfoX/Sxy family transcriptional regulator of competence genes
MTIEENRNVYDQLIESFAEVDLKGKTMHYTSMNGNMFSFVSKDGEMGFRMTKEDRAHYISKEGATEMIQHNCVMNGYVHVSETMIGDREKLIEIFSKSIEFAKTLKPKPTKKKK